MKSAVRVVAAVALMSSTAFGGEYAPLPKQLRHCSTVAIARADNDVQILDGIPRGDRTAVPEAVARSLDAATNWITRRLRYAPQGQADNEDLAKTRCRDVYPFANIVALPNGQTLYAVHAKSLFVHWLLLVVYDPVTGQATPKPAYINLKWVGPKDPLIKRPYVSLSDLRGDGHKQIVVEERGHNGNVYNAAVFRYFDIGPDLTLTNVLALEARTYDPFDDEDAIIERTLTPIDATHVRIDQTYVSGKKRISGGYADLESAAPGKPYHVSERHGIDKRVSPHFEISNSSLITMSEEDDDTFLKDGHGLYY